MGKRFDYEYIVIGSGPAGVTAAKQLAAAGRKVAIVEQDRWGGAAVNYRDIPQKALNTFSHLYADAAFGSRFGISSNSLRYNYPTVMHWRDKAIARAAKQKAELSEAGITCIKGKANFLGVYDLAVEGHGQISANKFVIATGAEPDGEKISGLDTVPYLTPASALFLDRAPKAVLVVGGGPSGCEIAQYYAELGAKVVIVEVSGRLLPKLDEEVGEVMTQYLNKHLGVKVFTKTRVFALEKDKISSRVVFMRDGQEKTVRVDTIVLATGSKPSMDLGLKNAGVNYDKNGIVVDRTLQTSARNIFAVGDVVGGESSTEKAIYTAEVAAMNMLGRNKTYVNMDGFMRIVDTNPQVAVVGATEDELTKRDKKYKKVVVPLSNVTASITSDFRIGFLKLMADHQGKILGATMVGPHAAEVLQEVALSIRHGLPLVQMASTPHVEGEWGNLVKMAARELLRKK